MQAYKQATAAQCYGCLSDKLEINKQKYILLVGVIHEPPLQILLKGIRKIGFYLLQYTAIASQINEAVPSACLSMLFVKRSSATYI